MIIKYKRNFTRDRNQKIVELCKDRKVLHVGSCDSPFTKDRVGKKGFLYGEIDQVCNKQLGIDLDKESIAFLNKNNFKNSNTIFFDMNKLEDLDFQPDVIIFGEVIEHLMNIEIALSNLKKVMDNNTILIISTPNAFNLNHFILALFGIESMHEDHKVLFSYGYLVNMLKFNNLNVEKGYFTFLSPFLLNKKGKILYYLNRFLSTFTPYLSDTLLFVCKLNERK